MSFNEILEIYDLKIAHYFDGIDFNKYEDVFFPGLIGAHKYAPNLKHNLESSNVFDLDFDKALLKYVAEVSSKLFPDEPFFSTPPKIQFYKVNKGHCKMHNDCRPERLMGFIYYLNDVKEGGETYFPNQNKLVKPERDKIIFFPTTMDFIHEGRVPLSNDKAIITGFVLGLEK